MPLVPLLALLLTGCPRPAPEPPPDPPNGRRTEAIAPLPDLLAAASDAEAYACEVDADCAVTCRRPGTCCDEPCTCTQVFRADFVARLEAQKSRMCRGIACPVAACMPATEATVAVCEAGRCVPRTRPIGPPPARHLAPPPEADGEAPAPD